VTAPVAADLLVHGAGELCTMEGAAASGPTAAGTLTSAALAAHEGIIVWVGPSDEAETSVALVPGAEVIDAGGAVVTRLDSGVCASSGSGL